MKSEIGLVLVRRSAWSSASWLHYLAHGNDPFSFYRNKFVEFDMKPVCKKCYEKFPLELKKRLKKLAEALGRKWASCGRARWRLLYTWELSPRLRTAAWTQRSGVRPEHKETYITVGFEVMLPARNVVSLFFKFSCLQRNVGSSIIHSRIVQMPVLKMCNVLKRWFGHQWIKK